MPYDTRLIYKCLNTDIFRQAAIFENFDCFEYAISLTLGQYERFVLVYV